MMHKMTDRPGIAAKTLPMNTPRLIQIRFSMVSRFCRAGTMNSSMSFPSYQNSTPRPKRNAAQMATAATSTMA